MPDGAALTRAEWLARLDLTKKVRPVTLSPALIAAYCEWLAKGHYPETAATACGLSIDIVRRWLQVGARATQGRELPKGWRPGIIRLCQHFLVAVQAAESLAESRVLGRLDRLGETQWLAAAWQLERRWPERWAPPAKRLEVSGPGGTPLGQPVKLLWPEQLQSANAGLQAAGLLAPAAVVDDAELVDAPGESLDDDASRQSAASAAPDVARSVQFNTSSAAAADGLPDGALVSGDPLPAAPSSSAPPSTTRRGRRRAAPRVGPGGPG